MEINLKPNYQFLLTSEEFRLISKALRGIVLTPDERQEAQALQEKMLTMRASQARIFMENVQKDVDNVERESAERK